MNAATNERKKGNNSPSRPPQQRNWAGVESRSAGEPRRWVALRWNDRARVSVTIWASVCLCVHHSSSSSSSNIAWSGEARSMLKLLREEGILCCRRSDEEKERWERVQAVTHAAASVRCYRGKRKQKISLRNRVSGLTVSLAGGNRWMCSLRDGAVLPTSQEVWLRSIWYGIHKATP